MVSISNIKLKVKMKCSETKLSLNYVKVLLKVAIKQNISNNMFTKIKYILISSLRKHTLLPCAHQSTQVQLKHWIYEFLIQTYILISKLASNNRNWSFNIIFFHLCMHISVGNRYTTGCITETIFYKNLKNLIFPFFDFPNFFPM